MHVVAVRHLDLGHDLRAVRHDAQHADRPSLGILGVHGHHVRGADHAFLARGPLDDDVVRQQRPHASQSRASMRSQYARTTSAGPTQPSTSASRTSSSAPRRGAARGPRPPARGTARGRRPGSAASPRGRPSVRRWPAGQVARVAQGAPLHDRRVDLVVLDALDAVAERLVRDLDGATPGRATSPASSRSRGRAPRASVSSVKCFSITRAPSATAATAVTWPGVWSDSPSTACGKRSA